MTEKKIRSALEVVSDEIHELEAEGGTVSGRLAVLWAESTEYLEATKEDK